ncbi:hypothetical protein [Microcoleus vaginatus]|uniref:hypothetical protein n=1 Tax=Microcoleus vaginatus TaxID=119532 RepID=UPI001689C1F9|nr:hypothetical protein [Microcoleus sp. FACHB-84]MBD2010209.1 hypothetical protein [Microcoleus sp. FACHB-45]
MELKILTFILGSILLLIGIFGGGFQIKELKIPQIGKFSRFLATSLGIFFILISLGLDIPPPSTTTTPPPPSPPTSSPPGIFRNGAVSFDLTNQTSRNIERFFASPANVNSWEEDILGTEVLRPGQKTKITIQDGRENCMYDFRARLGAAPNGSVGPGDMIQSQINICSDFHEWGFVEK